MLRLPSRWSTPRIGREDEEPVALLEGLTQLRHEPPAVQRQQIVPGEPTFPPDQVAEARAGADDGPERFAHRRRLEGQLRPPRPQPRYAIKFHRHRHRFGHFVRPQGFLKKNSSAVFRNIHSRSSSVRKSSRVLISSRLSAYLCSTT